MRIHRPLLLALALATTAPIVGDAAETRFPGAITRPATRGDQLIFFYDTRPGFTTFLSLRSTGASALPVQMLFYGPDMGAPFVHTATIPVGPGHAGGPGVGGTLTLDVGVLGASGLPAEAGIVFVTAVDESGAPLVTRALTGSFTVADLQTGSAWESVAAARSAVAVKSTTPSGSVPREGAFAGSRHHHRRHERTVAADPALGRRPARVFNPDSLAPAELGGNQIIFVTFEDVVGVPYGAKRITTEWEIAAVRDTGVPIEADPVETGGIAVTDLVSLLGSGARGARGSITFNAEPSAKRMTRLVFFTQSLATFGTGYLLPTR